MQNSMQIFSFTALYSSGSESDKFKEAISPKHLIASILDDEGTKKLFNIIGINSVSNIYAKGIQERNA